MNLSKADLARPAVRRLNKTINTLTAVIWFPLAVWRKLLFGIYWCFDWLFDWSFELAIALRDWIITCYLKWRPSPPCSHEDQWWSFENLFGHCKDCGADLKPVK